MTFCKGLLCSLSVTDAMSYHARRKDLQITDEPSLKKILKTAKYVTIAMCKNNQPYLISLSQGYDEKHNCIYFHCFPEGKKIDYLKSNNSIWGQAIIDYGYAHGECDQYYASVHFSGKVTFLDSLEEKREAVICMIKHLEKNPDPLIAKLNVEKLGKTTIGRIEIEHIIGMKSKKVTL
jgi:nitroimidazol reductase NimA-like FMN-containing flavoprotein (pyridoxamine 5'-phosphate oxidase superfamily)